VVHINTTKQVERPEMFGPLGPRSEVPSLQQGLGSGVVVDDRGYILTNNHVIGDATEVEVRLSDGRSVSGRRDEMLVGADPLMDLAVLKIDVAPLEVAPLGDSDALEVGDWVMAIGNPFGLDQTVTAGIVSAKGRRDVVESVAYQDFIQTDAAINVGNSGGPLVNLRGEIVGINTAIVGQNGMLGPTGNVGIGFAIPSNMARLMFEQLLAKGRIVRGWLGVSWARTTEAVIGDVLPYSPAADAGFQPGDKVVAFSGAKVEDWDDFRQRVGTTRVGQTVDAEVLRDGRRVPLAVTIGEFPTMELGYQVTELDPAEAQLLPPSERGVVVVNVFPQSRAERAGLKRNELIVGVGQTAVNDMPSYLRAISQVDLSGSVALQVRGEGDATRAVIVAAESR
jgi:serine protease Do